jgi:hypothetical protein
MWAPRPMRNGSLLYRRGVAAIGLWEILVKESRVWASILAMAALLCAIIGWDLPSGPMVSLPSLIGALLALLLAWSDTRSRFARQGLAVGLMVFSATVGLSLAMAVINHLMMLTVMYALLFLGTVPGVIRTMQLSRVPTRVRGLASYINN